ncbi:hypothetical protein PF010_g24980 [Phytophthora fragariae]|uniref:Uncharacterized protein n=1 Tax=Phytophthora fragariae TaxID=53985 RepID=A0A6G0K0Z2_9STRA|nr:hypothetical protein PF010_g24980 [Phytophthora fragariae]KAE9226644.1 hypothetical protein PF004_g11586 [Phytophthora fragariae]
MYAAGLSVVGLFGRVHSATSDRPPRGYQQHVRGVDRPQSSNWCQQPGRRIGY